MLAMYRIIFASFPSSCILSPADFRVSFTRFARLPSLVYCTLSLWVMPISDRYLYRGREDYPLIDDSGAFLADDFRFMTSDARGANSTEAVAHVQVLSSLFAMPSSIDFVSTSSSSSSSAQDDEEDDDRSSSDPKRKEYLVYEATPGNVTVYIGDLSDDQRRCV